MPGGSLVFDTFFPSLEIVGAPQNTRVLEGRVAASGDRPADANVRHAQLSTELRRTQHSLNEIELLSADGSVQSVHRSEVRSRYIYKHEMDLLLRVAGFAHWEIYGDFDRRPLTRENDAMVVIAWNT